jgi:hypothetical protein
VDHLWVVLMVMLRRSLGTAAGVEVSEGAGFLEGEKMNSVGSFSPKVRSTWSTFFRFASVSSG